HSAKGEGNRIRFRRSNGVCDQVERTFPISCRNSYKAWHARNTAIAARERNDCSTGGSSSAQCHRAHRRVSAGHIRRAQAKRGQVNGRQGGDGTTAKKNVAVPGTD